MTTPSNSKIMPDTNQMQTPFEQIDFEEQFCQMPDILVPDAKFRLINHIDINQKHLLLSTKTGLYLFDLKQSNLNTPKVIIESHVTHAVFIPNSHYVAYSINKTGQNQDLHIFNINQHKPAARIKIDSPIEQIKTSKTCLGITTLQQIFILHFPTLKPIYNGPAGNYVNLIFDLSRQGLTLAHNSFDRGEVIIRNFTNIKKNNALTERKRSIYSSRVRQSNLKPSEGFNMSSALQEDQEIEAIIKINAHKDLISQIKVSPNGSKVVTSSLKGTVLPVFSTKNGQKLEQFRVGYEIVKIVDISFVKDGNVLGCMNDTGMIFLYNVSMDKQQIEYEKRRKGHKIYTQTNPKSLFSFLSFLYPPLNDSFSFNHFKLINPQFKEESNENIDTNIDKSFSKSQSGIDDQKSVLARENDKFNHSIEEVEEQHLQEISPERSGQKSHSFQSSSSLLSRDNNQTSKKTEKGSCPSQKGLPESKPLRESLKVESSPGKRNRQTSPSKANSIESGSRLTSRQRVSRNSSKIKNMGKRRGSSLLNMQKQAVDNRSERNCYNMTSRVYITEGNYIWAVKGYHVFGLKYDSFHGGEMVLDKSMKIV